MMVAMEAEGTEEVVEAMAEAEEEDSAEAGVEAVAVAAATEDHAGKSHLLTFGHYSAGLARRHGVERFKGPPSTGEASAPRQERI